MRIPATYSIQPRTFHFRQPAGTSRGVYTTRKSWMLTLKAADGTEGKGECAPLPDLSYDWLPDYEEKLQRFCQLLIEKGSIPVAEMLPYPSMLFGMETAMLHLQRGSAALLDTPWSRGEEGIPINGLVWMGRIDEMMARIQQKLDEGFRCIKLKIGALGWKEETAMLQRIRREYDKEEVELRVDANGGFLPNEAPDVLEVLAAYGVHSIEQPIRAGQWDEMARLCRQSPVPIALDEELIGWHTRSERAHLLDHIRPSYIILKPSLHGGMQGVREWVELASERGIGSWITSALESNVGLNAVAQLTASIYGPGISLPQGLGTGMLYTDNIPYPLEMRGQKLWFKP